MTWRFIPTGIMGVLTVVVVTYLILCVLTYLLLIFSNILISILYLLFTVPIPPTMFYFVYSLLAMVLSVFGVDTAWPSLTLFVFKSLL